MRVHELAKQYGKSNKEFLDIIKNLGIEGKSHLSGLTEEEELIIIEGLEDKKPSKKEEKTEKKSKNNKKQEIIKEAVEEEIEIEEYIE